MRPLSPVHRQYSPARIKKSGVASMVPKYGPKGTSPVRASSPVRSSCRILPGASSRHRSWRRPCQPARVRSVPDARSGRRLKACSDVMRLSRPKGTAYQGTPATGKKPLPKSLASMRKSRSAWRSTALTSSLSVSHTAQPVRHDSSSACDADQAAANSGRSTAALRGTAKNAISAAAALSPAATVLSPAAEGPLPTASGASAGGEPAPGCWEAVTYTSMTASLFASKSHTKPALAPGAWPDAVSSLVTRTSSAGCGESCTTVSYRQPSSPM